MTTIEKQLSSLDYDELNEVVQKASQLRDMRKKEAQQETIQKIRDLVVKRGFTMDELLGTKARRVVRKMAKSAKYRNPSNPDQTWTGQGRKPNWLVAELGKGKDIAQFSA